MANERLAVPTPTTDPTASDPSPDAVFLNLPPPGSLDWQPGLADAVVALAAAHNAYSLLRRVVPVGDEATGLPLGNAQLKTVDPASYIEAHASRGIIHAVVFAPSPSDPDTLESLGDVVAVSQKFYPAPASIQIKNNATPRTIFCHVFLPPFNNIYSIGTLFHYNAGYT